ncbi:hypothetical protein PVK06_040014 [Gossypium arboreum]|uniref:Uncharacterized protein n=1 Tax=Gossypium arboreum TaxID=29729 RepID=A0ABR0N6H2_GOSAR|nr:hypothetical protein PVK06_040014 [Gossypium arboreum]
MSIVEPDAAHASEFSEYLAILHSHRLAKDPKHEELFVGQNSLPRKATSQRLEIWKFVGPRTSTSTRITVREHGIMEILPEKLADAGNLDAKNRVDTSKQDGGGYVFFEEMGKAMIRIVKERVPPLTFKLVINKGYCRKSKGFLQVTRILSEMDMREKTNHKPYGVYRTTSYN